MSGQTVAAPALKAAFLYNFAKFTQWPAEALKAGAPLIMCANDDEVADALARATEGRVVDGHRVEVRPVGANAPRLRDCHVLYVSDLDRTGALQLLETLKGAPVLTVSDLDQFVQIGGVAQFFVEGGQMRFAINLESARRAGLQLSSKLLSLAKIA